jgi:hypothetical protein
VSDGRDVGVDRPGARLTRREFARRSVAFAAGAVFARPLLSLADASASTARSPVFVSPAVLAQARRNLLRYRLAFATRAWTDTLTKANNWLGYQPHPTDPTSDVSDWVNTIYIPGLKDGNAALTLAVAYAVAGRADHAARAKSICLAWARTYNPPPPRSKIGHMVAEPVGPVIKLCMAFDLTRGVFTAAEQADFVSWATHFVGRGMANVDYARDSPWVPDVTYGGVRTNPAPYGNSATWQRAMAMWAAAAAGPAGLRAALRWNFSHTTAGGHDSGWDNLLEGLVVAGGGGQVVEDRYRSSIEYGHFSWMPTVLIADLARNAGIGPDLFRYRTKRHGYTVFTPVSYYAPFLMRAQVPATLEKGQYGGSSWPSTASRWRGWYELLYRNATDPFDVRLLRRTVNWGGSTERGDNYDIYILGYPALFGRGPQGPKPAEPAKHAKPSKRATH